MRVSMMFKDLDWEQRRHIESHLFTRDRASWRHFDDGEVRWNELTFTTQRTMREIADQELFVENAYAISFVL